MPKGTIRQLQERGFGFIKTEEGKDLFFHRSKLEGVEFSYLRAGGRKWSLRSVTTVKVVHKQKK